MPKIVDIEAYEILDSRGNPTVKAKVTLDSGLIGEAAVPSGASKGIHEAVELRDNDSKRFGGMGVLCAIEQIRTRIKPVLLGMDPTLQTDIDEKMIQLDGTPNKASLGANSMLAVSLAVCRCGAGVQKLPLYRYLSEMSGIAGKNHYVTPLFNIVNGGMHGCGTIDFQEFLLIPDPRFPFADALRMGAEVYQLLKKTLKETHHIYSIGDEGGFTPDYGTNNEVLKTLLGTIELSDYKYGKDIHLGIDFASSTYFESGVYYLEKRSKTFYTPAYNDYLVELQKEFALYLLEDPIQEDDWQNWTDLTERIGTKAKIVGDDLLVTNLGRLQKGVSVKACNSILIKVNQIGTLSETIEVIKYARQSGLTVIISHRSGETVDPFISDLAVGVGADFVKFGAPARGERVVKYNRLLSIYREFTQ